ncbi:MAG: M23 family metallopeptidase [bacterium]|nr:M23 family metallopeptidase [bacterium]
MVFKRINILALLMILGIALPGCSDFNAIFNGKPNHSVAKKGKRPKREAKRRHKKVPEYAKKYFKWPLFAPVSSGYGPRWGRFHEGIDIDGDFGDSILAAAPGRVVYSGKLGGYGRLVVIRHDNGFFTAYAHNKKNLVKKGKKVNQGERIALVGSSGRSTGSHLHFEIRDKKGTYDPLAFLPSKRYSRR